MSILMIAALALAASQQTPSPEPVTLRVVSAPKKGAGEIKFDGKALFPDGVALKGTLFRAEERLVEGVLEPELTEIVSEVATVEGRRVSFTMAVKDPGHYRLVVELREDLQEPDLLRALTKSLPGKWIFEHASWGDDLVSSLGSKLRDFDVQVDTCLTMVRRFAQSSASNQSWKDNYPQLDKELGAFLKKFDQTPLERVLPAAVLELRCTMRNLKGNSEAMVFNADGSCKGSIDYRTQQPTKTIHSQDFTFEAILKDVEAARAAAGREFALWLIKDARRSGPRPELTALLRTEAKHPGVAPHVEALDGFKETDGVEKQIRGK
jgi:hypothetical protein